jgi:hypothetical protein
MALGDNQPSLDRLSEADLVCEDTTAFAKASKGKNYCVNLVRIWINARLSLGCGIALAIVRTADANEILGENALVERVKYCHGRISDS